jgi:mannose-1-phosphate guanylyltransferase
MKVILLAAGLGVRLRPVTNDIPKCLVPINGKPLLYIWLEQLSEAGATEFYINTHYFSHKVEQAIAAHPLSSKVNLVFEEFLLGTAGTVKNMLSKFDFSEDTLIAHADNLCFCDWKTFIEEHHNRPLGTTVTMMGFETDDPQSCGILEVDEHSTLTALHEKVAKPPGNLANAAIYLFSSDALKIFSGLTNSENDLTNDLLPKVLQQIYVWPTTGYVRDIGNPSSYQKGLKESKHYIY